MQGERYYQRAIKLAYEINDPIMIAHSLNRLGNWHLNHEEPLFYIYCFFKS